MTVRAPLTALILVLAVFAASCGTGAPSSATSEASSTDATPASTAAGTQTSDTPGSCADELTPGSPEQTACAWIANADVAICERMSDALLTQLFSTAGDVGREGCAEILGGVPAADDKVGVTFEQPVVTGDQATLEMLDRGGDRTIRYLFGFIRSGGIWLLDSAEQLEASEAEDTAPASPEDEVAIREIRTLVQAWYAKADPSVCASMTDEMLDFGWGKTGDRGRRLCEKSLAGADPVGNVKVRRPRIQGDRARVQVVYTRDESRQIDRINLVRSEGEWLIDSVALAGFAP